MNSRENISQAYRIFLFLSIIISGFPFSFVLAGLLSTVFVIIIVHILLSRIIIATNLGMDEGEHRH